MSETKYQVKKVRIIEIESALQLCDSLLRIDLSAPTKKMIIESKFPNVNPST